MSLLNGPPKPAATEWPEFAIWLREMGYENPVQLDDDRWAALAPKFFTTMLVTGEIGDTTGISNGWCYETFDRALAGQTLWAAAAGAGEPSGWFRHPSTGRRIARAAGETDDQGRVVPIGEEYVRR